MLVLVLLVPLFVRASPTINETEILQWHLPTPPSYWSTDIQDRDPNVARDPALIALHVLFMSLAFFVALPARTLLPISPSQTHILQESLSALLIIPTMVSHSSRSTLSPPSAVLPAVSTENSPLTCKRFLP